MTDKHVNDRVMLQLVKTAHTLIWGFFVACIVAIPMMTWQGRDDRAGLFIVIVLGEVLVLALNRGTCPLTPVAGRYTSNRDPNFDIYLPARLARYNKEVFGTLFVAGALYALLSRFR